MVTRCNWYRTGERFANERIYVMLPFERVEPPKQPPQILIGTRTQGLMLFDGHSFQPFRTEADAFLLENQLYHGAVLSDGTFALATLRNGVIIIDRHGRIRQHLNKESGLQDENVKYVYPDRQGGLWLALNDGISRVEVPGPFMIFDDYSGLKTDVHSIRRHEGVLYVATNLGVSYLNPMPVAAEPAESKAKLTRARFPVDPQKLLRKAGLCCHSRNHHNCWLPPPTGFIQIKNHQAKFIKKSENSSFVCFFLYRSKVEPNRVFVGLLDGLASLRMSDGQWIDEGRIPEITEQIHTIVENDAGELWLGTSAQGVLRVKFATNAIGNDLAKPQVSRFNAEQGLPEGWIDVFSTSTRSVFTSEFGPYFFDEQTETFLADTTFDHAFTGEDRGIGPFSEEKSRKNLHDDQWGSSFRSAAAGWFAGLVEDAISQNFPATGLGALHRRLFGTNKRRK